jgi:hypothetical protein
MSNYQSRFVAENICGMRGENLFSYSLIPERERERESYNRRNRNRKKEKLYERDRYRLIR